MKLDENLFKDYKEYRLREAKRKKKYNVKTANMNVAKNIEFFNHINGFDTSEPVGADSVADAAGGSFGGGDFSVGVTGAGDGGGACCAGLKRNKHGRKLSEILDDQGIDRYGIDGKWWYFTLHGIGPGAIPRGAKVIEVRDGVNKKGTHGTFVALDRILNTSELDRYDLIELEPVEESCKKIKNESSKKRISSRAKRFSKIMESIEDNNKFSAYITNLGKYNEGYLVGNWVEFPMDEDEFQKELKKIGIGSRDEFGAPYEEWFCSDYEDPYGTFYSKYGEYPSYEALNEYGKLVDSIDDKEKIENIIEATGCSLEEAVDNKDDYVFIKDANNNRDVGYYFMDSIGEPSEEEIERYFDYEQLGRDLSFDEYYCENDDGEEIDCSAGEYWCGDENATDEQIGEAFVDEVGFDGVNDKEYYFDYDAYGKDFEPTFTKDGAIISFN